MKRLSKKVIILGIFGMMIVSFLQYNYTNDIPSRQACVYNTLDPDSKLLNDPQNIGDSMITIVENRNYTEITSFTSIKCYDEEISQIIKKINNSNNNDTSSKIIFANNDRILIRNDNYIVACKFTDKKLDSAIALNKFINLDNHSQINGFSISPNGKYIIIGTGNSNENLKSNLYCCNLDENIAFNISKENYENIIDAWSSNGKYYTYSNKGGKNISLYDVINNKLIVIPFEKGKIKDIFIDVNGNIIVNSSKKYFLDKNNNYKINEISISGKIINYENGNLVFYDNGNIRNYNCGEFSEITNISEDYNLVKYNRDRAVFSNSNSVEVYSFIDKQVYDYNIKYEEAEYIYFSPDSKRCIVMDNQHRFKLLSYNGKAIDMDNEDFLNYLGKYRWLDNNNLIRLNQTIDTVSKEQNTHITKINIQTGEESSIYKFD